MAIVDLDSGSSRGRRAGDGAVIAALGGAIAVFALALWLSAPHPTAVPIASSPQPSAVPITTAICSRNGAACTPPLLLVASFPPPVRPLALPPGQMDGVDLFLLPERITNENLIWTLRSVVVIRGGQGLASVEGPAVVTWTEKGFQYWMISSTRTTDELIKIADDLR
jgi:hypothetical protein